MIQNSSSVKVNDMLKAEIGYAFKPKPLTGGKLGHQVVDPPWECELCEWDQYRKRSETKEI